MNDFQELVDLLTSSQLRVSTGLWLLSLEYIGNEEDEAHRLGIEPIDIRTRLLQSLPEGTKFSGLTPDSIFSLINKESQESGDWPGVMIYNLDLLISRLTSTDQAIIWQDLFTALPHRRRGVLFTIPETAENLFPSKEIINELTKEHRIIKTNPTK